VFQENCFENFVPDNLFRIFVQKYFTEKSRKIIEQVIRRSLLRRKR